MVRRCLGTKSNIYVVRHLWSCDSLMYSARFLSALSSTRRSWIFVLFFDLVGIICRSCSVPIIRDLASIGDKFAKYFGMGRMVIWASSATPNCPPNASQWVKAIWWPDPGFARFPATQAHHSHRCVGRRMQRRTYLFSLTWYLLFRGISDESNSSTNQEIGASLVWPDSFDSTKSGWCHILSLNIGLA